MSAAAQQEFYRKIYQRSHHSKPFTFAQIREDCGIDASDKQARNRAWNWLRKLLREEIVEELPLDRKRHKYYQVVDADALAEELSASENGGAPDAQVEEKEEEKHDSSPSGFGLLQRLEENAKATAEKVEKMDERLERMETTQAELKRKLDHLVAMWS